MIYDGENRLTEARKYTVGTSTMLVGEYSYDAVGRRSEKKVTAGMITTRYMYAGDQVLAEYNQTNTMQRRYVYGPGIDNPLMVEEADGTRHYLHRDGKGSIMAASHGNGTDLGEVAFKFTADAWGFGADETTSPYRFTARRMDEETGNYYYRNRYYHPDSGRFMSNDPIGYGDGLNMYAYAYNDPVNYTDPMGLTPQAWLGRDEGGASPPVITVTGVDLRDALAARFASDLTAALRGIVRSANLDDVRTDLDSRLTDEFAQLLEAEYEIQSPLESLQNCLSDSQNGDNNNDQQSLIQQIAQQAGALGLGIGDAFTFGYYSKAFSALPGQLGENYARQAELGGREFGLYGAGGVGLARLGYARLVGSIGNSGLSAQQAVSKRNQLKGIFSGFFSRHPRIKSYEALLKRYGTDARIIEAASRSNSTLNAAGATAASSALLSALADICAAN